MRLPARTRLAEALHEAHAVGERLARPRALRRLRHVESVGHHAPRRQARHAAACTRRQARRH